MILFVMTPFILSTCIYNVNTYVNQTIFSDMMKVKGLTEVAVAVQYSAVDKAAKISTIPIALASAMSAAIMPGIAGDFARKRHDHCRDRVGKAIRSMMFVCIPAAVGIAVLAKPLMLVLYPQKETIELSSHLLMISAAGVIFYSLSTLSSGILQGIGSLNRPVIHAAIALIVQTIALIAALMFTDLGTYAMPMTVVLFAFLMCIMNATAVRRHLEYRQEWDRTFLRPIIMALIMGVCAYGVYNGLYLLTEINIVSLLAAVLVGVIAYLIIAIRWQVLGEAEIRWMPYSHQLTKLVKGIGVHKRFRVEEKVEDDDYWLDDGDDE
jgi:stage V sporulation protein B